MISLAFLHDPETGWIKVPERLVLSSPFLKMPPTGRAMALAVFTAGSGHAASEGSSHLDTNLLPGLLAQSEDVMASAVDILVAHGIWARVDDDIVDTGMESQLATREESRMRKSRAGQASAAKRSAKARADDLGDQPF